MKHVYQEIMKGFLHKEMVKTVEDLKLTKERTAEILGIDTRSFAYLKAGRTMCSATTLLLYLAKLCPNPAKFIENLRTFVGDAEQ